MQCYAVGGAVRDVLLGFEPKDIDFVWTGISPQFLLDKGYTPVGRDFPVFLDQNGNEHALARLERKTGSGYHGFDVDFSPSVTIEQDLFRRDLTINSLAVKIEHWDQFVKTKDVSLVIDCYGGINDLLGGDIVLRHVSGHFAEDPLRVLRVARFAARYQNTVIVLSTFELMKQIVQRGEIQHLSTERIWTEVCKGIDENYAYRFFDTLQRCGAYKIIFNYQVNNIDRTWNVNKQTKNLQKITSHELWNNLNIDDKLVLLFFYPEEDVTALLSKLKAPARLIKTLQYMHLVESTQLVSNCDYINLTQRLVGLDRLMVLFMLYRQLCDTWCSSPILKMSKLMIAHAICCNIGFSNLTKQQQQTLKGKQISEAIDRLRCKYMGKDVFYFTE